MGQKVNPIIFRLGKTTNWKQKYFEKRSTESAIYSFQDQEIKKFIDKFFKDNGLIVKNCVLHYLAENSIHIYISYYLTFKSTFLLTKINKQQNIKLIKSKKKIKRKKYLGIKKNVKNFINYQQLYYNISLSNYIKKKDYKKIKKVFQTEQKMLKIRRMRLLKSYKQNLNINKYSKISRINLHSFLENLFKSLQLFLNKNLKIFLTIKQVNKNLKENLNSKKIKLVKKKLVNMKKYEKNDFFKEGVNILYTCSTEPNSANLLAEFISNQLQKLKRHNFFLKFIKSTLNIFKSQNIKIKIKGRFNGSPRAKRKIINIGNGVPVLTLNSNIDYAEKTSFTANGTFGVKVWINKNK
jgi:ribosomal protein S3